MTIDKKIKVNGIKSGFILGAIISALSIFYFYYVTSLVKSAILLVAGPVFFYLFIPIFAIVFLCFDARKRVGGYWSARQATTGIFIMFAIAYFIYLIAVNLIFYKVVEPDYLHKTQVASVAARTNFMKQNGADQKTIDKTIAEMNKSISNQGDVTIGSTVLWIGIYIMFIFIFALIFGSLFKKDPPVYQAS